MMRPLFTVLGFVIVGTLGFAIGRTSAPKPVLPRLIAVDQSEWEPIRFGRYGEGDRVPGSTEAVNWLEAEHKAGRVVGKHGSNFTKQFRLARTIGIGSSAIEIEHLCMDKPDGHFAIITIDPKTGTVIKADFGEY